MCSVFLSAIFWLPVHAQTQPATLNRHEQTVDLSDVKLRYYISGSGPVIFVPSPGWGIGSLYLQHGLKSLESKFTLIYIDTRGSGGSSRPVDDLSMTQSAMADDIEKIRERIGIDEITALGHSDAGAIAIEYAVRHPEHLRNLILVEPAVLGDRDTSASQAILNLWADDPQYRDAIREVRTYEPSSLKDDESFSSSLMKMLLLYLGDPEKDLSALADSIKGSHPSSYAARAESKASHAAKRSQTQGLGKIRARTLVINGTADWICPYPVAQRLKVGIQNSTLQLYANKGHFPWIESRARFFSDIVTFMSGKSAAAAR
jgi:pimeloyl-ACP methyl ester carboxylesterase